MAEVQTSGASEQWSKRLRERVDQLVGLASTSSSKYDEFKGWLAEELEVSPSVCYLSDLAKQWTARVGQAFMGLPSLMVLLIEGEPQRDVLPRLERLHGYATGLEGTLVFFGTEGAWQLDSVVGVPGRPAFDMLRCVVSEGKSPAESSARPRIARPGGSFFDLEPDAEAELVWTHLVGQGAMPVQDAIAIAAKALRDDGALDYARLRTDGLVYSEIEAAMAYASRRGFLFDRPRSGYIRAIKSDPDEFTRDDWRKCMLGALTETWVERDTAVRDAAVRAVDVYGLNMVRLRSGGRVDSAIRSALNGLIRMGRIERGGKDQVRLVDADLSGKSGGTASHPDSVTQTLQTEAAQERTTLPGNSAPLSEAPASFEASPGQLRRLVGHLPAESENSFMRLLGEPQRSREELLEEVLAHVERFEQEFLRHEFLDVGGALLLKEQAERLLAAWNDLDFGQRQIAQAGMRYFAISDEGDDDFVIDGLRTDKVVMAAVIEAVL